MFFIVISNYNYSQNLVTNGSFESGTVCTLFPPAGYYLIATGWNNAANYPGFGGSSIDHSCSGFTYLAAAPALAPPNGSFAIGMGAGGLSGPSNFTEAVTTTLTSPITAGSTVNVSIAIKPRTNGESKVHDPLIDFGFYFYSTANVPGDFIRLTATPQHVVPTTSLTLESWTTYTASFVLSTTESKVAIGFFNPLDNFSDDSRYFAIDNVIITATPPPCPTAPTGTGGNASVCGSNAFTFPSRTCATGTLRWYENNIPSGSFYTGASVIPTATTTYYPYCFSTCNSPAGNPATATHTCPVSGSGSAWNWTGCTSTDWFNPCNWDRGSIPNTTSNVIIPFTSNQPVISGGTANCYDIQIQSGTGAQINIVSSSAGILNVVKP